jgi:Zn-dependent M28 family amino/carboxypeptidase
MYRGLRPGALDDGAGVGIVTAAAKLMLDSGRRPRRTVRVVLFANEENGFDGAIAYAQKYKDQPHQMVAESDMGAGLVYRIQSRVRAEALPVIAQIAAELAPLGIEAGGNEGNPGPDAGVLMRRNGWPAMALNQDGSDYFDFHHTPNDTLDKIDPVKLRQNVAAWAVMGWLAAQSPVAFGAGGAR